MADVDPETECLSCQHMASVHEDTDSGDNTGGCSQPDCTCAGMTTGEADMGVLTPIVTLADAVSGGSANAPSGANTGAPTDLAQSLDDLLDTATQDIGALTFADLQPEEQSAVALLNAASAAVDLLLVALGAADDDAMAADELDPGQDSTSLAEAADAAIVAARDLFASVDTPSDGIAAIITLTHQADEASGQVLAALKAPDPDVEDGDDPDAGGDGTGDDPSQPTGGMAAEGGAAFADPPADGDGGTPAPAPADQDGANAPSDGEDPNLQFTMPVMVLEGVDTGDGRFISEGVLTWRTLPLPVMALTQSSHGGFTDPVADLVGRIDTIERIDASALINAKTGEPYGPGVQALVATGTFNTLEIATEVAALVRDKFLTGVSVDVGDTESILEILDDDGNVIASDGDELIDIMFGDGNWRENLIAGRVMGVTICPFPAFEGAYIEMANGASTSPVQASVKPSESHALTITDEFGARECTPCEEGQVLTAAAGPMHPPRDWFQDPQLPGPTPLTVTDDGRVYGHLAAWATCHTGISGRCTTAPKSKNDYANFHVGALKTLDGDVISVGHITLGTGHADMMLNAGPALAHYDNTGSVAADICVGEDKHGIWFAGATRPDLTDLQLRQLRASALSGDWRQVGRGLELLAALAVNVPGFPLPRARTASAATVALVAAGGRTLLNRALGGRNAELEDLREWQRKTQPVLELYIEDRAAAARARMLDTRAASLRARIHPGV